MLLRKCGEIRRGARAQTELERRRRRSENAGCLVTWNIGATSHGALADQAAASQTARGPGRELERPPERGDRARAGTFEGVAWLWHVLGQTSSARVQWSELLRLAARSTDTADRAETLNLVGQFASAGGDAATAQALFHEALIAGRAGQDAASVARSLSGLVRVSVSRGAFELARTLQQEAL